MPETWYRASRCCRLLGNPTAYFLLKAMGRDKTTPTELSQRSGIHLYTVCRVLRDLRNLDMVRYLVEGVHKTYWIKDPQLVKILSQLESFVERLRLQKR